MTFRRLFLRQKVILWPPDMHCGMHVNICTHTHTQMHTSPYLLISFENQLLSYGHALEWDWVTRNIKQHLIFSPDIHAPGIIRFWINYALYFMSTMNPGRFTLTAILMALLTQISVRPSLSLLHQWHSCQESKEILGPGQPGKLGRALERDWDLHWRELLRLFHFSSGKMLQVGSSSSTSFIPFSTQDTKWETQGKSYLFCDLKSLVASVSLATLVLVWSSQVPFL